MDISLPMIACAAMIAAALGAAIPSSSSGAHAPSPRQEGAEEAETWRRWEHRLRSSRRYDNPYADVTVSVTYEGPKGTTLRSYGFWDGGDTFTIRCAFPQPGRWRWRTSCSDADNTGLHDRSGMVKVTPYPGPNELYRHGFLRVSDTRRYLTYADGTPFLWLGDTAWAACARASEEDWQRYVDDRASKGFSVVHLAPVPRAWMKTETDSAGNPAFIGEDSAQWNPAYWQGFERKVQYANARGIVVFVVGIMGSAKDNPDPARAGLFARNIAARLFGNSVVFSPAFDSDYDVVGLMREVGEELRRATSAHLITNHFGTIRVEENLHAAEWLDFDMFQSGHNGWREADEQLRYVTERARRMPLYLRQLMPAKPCVNGEAIYDGDPAANRNQHANAFRARQAGYLSLLSGACGYSFGVAGIWDWGARDRRGTWSKSISSVSSHQMAHLGRLFRSLEWWRLEPAHDLIVNQAKEEWERMVLARSGSGDLALAYLPGNDVIEIDMTAFPNSMSARWFSPVTGQYVAGPAVVSDARSHVFARPDDGDWVLLLEQVERSEAARAGRS